MSRSGYSDEADDEGRAQLWRRAVANAIGGRRGQAFLREMAAALDALPVKELVAEDIVRDSEHVCAMGAVALARRLDVSELDIEDAENVASAFGIAQALAREIAFENDEGHASPWETPSERWTRMRKWVADHILEPEKERS